MQIDLQKILNYGLMILAVCGGIIAGGLSGQIVDLLLSSAELQLPKTLTSRPVARQLQEADFQVILDRSLFDSSATGQSAELVDLAAQQVVAKTSKPVPTRAEMVLVGTVVAGENSLALVQVGRKAGVFRLQEEISPGIVVVEITRLMVALKENGVRSELLLKQRKQPQARPVRQGGTAVGKGAVVALGENRWQVSRTAVDNARANLNSLLQTARMVPQIQNGKTTGFKLVELDRGSLLEQMGLRVGDLVVEINQVALNSPEKALQIFQQVREATNISLGLVRNGQRESFEYRFE